MRKAYINHTAEKKLTYLFRLLSLMGRAVLIFFTAKILSVDEFAVFGLISAYTAFFVLFNGLDFIRTVQNDIKQNLDEGPKFFIQALFLFVCSVNIIFVIAVGGGAASFLGDEWLAGLFLMLVVAEYSAQEAGRVLVIQGRQLAYSCTLFFRSCLPIPIILSVLVLLGEVGLYQVLLVLVCMSFLSAIFSWWLLFNTLPNFFKFEKFKVYIEYILTGIKRSFLFFMSTAATKALFAADKTMLDRLYPPDVLSAYVLLIGAALVVVPLVDVFYGAYALPEFHDMKRERRATVANKFYKMFYASASLITAFCISGVAAFIVFGGVVFPEYTEIKLSLIIPTFLISAIFSITLIPNLMLIANASRTVLAASSIFALTSFGCTSLVISFIGGSPESIVISLAVILLIVFLWRFHKVVKVINEYPD